MNVHDIMIHECTAYHKRMSKAGWDLNLALLFQAVDRVEGMVAGGADIIAAVSETFNDSLRTRINKAILKHESMKA